MSDEADTKPSPRGQFKKGASGNPAGRPRSEPRFRERMERMGLKGEQFAEATLDAALELKKGDLSEGASALRNTTTKVLQIVFEHAHGKPSQHIEADVKLDTALPIARALAALEERLKEGKL